MLNLLTSVPAVAGVALATTALLTRDMIEGERMRSTGGNGNRRRRSFGLVCALILLVLVVLRFVTLAG